MQENTMTEPRHRSDDVSTAQFSRRTFLKVSAAGAAGALFEVPGIDLSRDRATALVARRKAGVLQVAWGGAPATLDPLTASADTEIAFLNAAYDYLLDTNDHFELVPRLATQWSASPDGLTYTLQIAEGVKFQDGSDLTIDDIIWTYNRLQSQGPTADLLANVTSIEAGDGNTLVFKLNSTDPDFLYNLTDNHTVILKAGAQDIGKTFNGTGPFILQEYATDHATFTANKNYWAGAPGVDSLEFIYFDNVEAAVNALKGGVVDAVLRLDNATFLSLSQEGGYDAQSIPTSGHDLARLRADRAPGSDVRVRQAFRLATDRKAIFDRVQFGFGSVGRDSPIAPIFTEYYTEETPLPARDPAAAKQLLAEAGYPNGLDMTLYTINNADRVALAQALAAQWKEAGINITIQPEEEAVYYADNGWLQVDLGITPWGARPVPQQYLDLYLKTGAKWNESHWSDPELDKWIDIAGTSMDQAQRVQAYHEVQRIMIERGPIIIPYFFASLGVMADYVKNVQVHPFPGRTDFRAATVAS
jgi:peptide/nickel transport system substrate-binding protein